MSLAAVKVKCLMQAVLKRLQAERGFDIGCVVTGQHLVAQYGGTVREIEASKIPVLARIHVDLNGSSGVQMGTALAKELMGFLNFWESNRPDLVLILGDRGEMLAAALAAVHLGIHIAHIHGGEISGTIDESFRHAISKLAHFHFVATFDAAQRLIRMGEHKEHIWVIGAPGLVDINQGTVVDPNWFCRRFQLEARGEPSLVVFHPVVQEADCASKQLGIILDYLLGEDVHGLVLRPNSDAGGEEMDHLLDEFSRAPEVIRHFRVLKHLERKDYLNCLANCKFIIGNSSSGIIESASFGLACINIGSRQRGRLRNSNVIECENISHSSLRHAFKQARQLHPPFYNQYGDGNTAEMLVSLLSHLELKPDVLSKANAY